MNISKIALGPFHMLRCAVLDHRRKYREYPKRIELHPEVCADLKRDLRSEYMGYVDTTGETLKFMGVPLIVDKRATRPKLITSKNEVEYL